MLAIWKYIRILSKVFSASPWKDIHLFFIKALYSYIVTISHKHYWDSLYFHTKILKKCLSNSKVPRISPPPDSMLCQVWKSCPRQWWPGMSNQTCNQNWTRGHGVRISQFLWLIVAIYTIQLVDITRNPLISYLTAYKTVYKTMYKTHHGPVIAPFPVQYFKWLLQFFATAGVS